ncbi:MAG: NFACT family protein, partial [Hadesarchaea archaeon]|nr:NFACT family protein [Hadesarchaea archaeon]
MKKKMSSLDIKFCVEELQELLSSWTDKIYEIDGTFLIKFHHPEEGRKELIIEPGKRIHLTKMKYPTPKKPPDFPMLLRKHLSNYRLTKVKQPDLERIVELVFEKKDEEKILIAELFGAGNLVLCDKNYEIIQPYQREDWGTRTIRPNEKYDYPPKKGIDIRSIKKSDL